MADNHASYNHRKEYMNGDYKWLEKLTNKTLKETFEGAVEEVVLKYKFIYKSFAGDDIKERTEVITKDMPANFYFECPNPECTEKCIYITDEVRDAISRRDTTFSCVTTCSGKTARDHSHQRCDVRVEYTIRIQYSQS